MAKFVFISYSKDDAPQAEQICQLLGKEGIHCWIAPRDVSPGKPYGEQIIQAISDADALVLVLSPSANASRFVRSEVERGFSKGKSVIPIRLERVEPSLGLELFVSSAHWIDAWGTPLEAAVRRLAGAVRSQTESAQSETEAVAAPPPPDDQTLGEEAGSEDETPGRTRHRWLGLAALTLLFAGGTGYVLWPSNYRRPDAPPDRCERANVVIGYALDSAMRERLERARSQLDACRGQPSIDPVLRELEQGILVAYQYRTRTETSLLMPLQSADGVTLTSNDSYRLAFLPRRECFLYVFQTDSGPEVTQLFPNDRYSQSVNPLQADRVQWLPNDPEADGSLWLQLDDRVSTERIYVLAVRQPLSEPERFKKRLLAAASELRDEATRRTFLEGEGLTDASCFAAPGGPMTMVVLNHR